MYRMAWPAAVALTLAIGATFAQSRSGTVDTPDPADARRPAGGFRAVGAFGGEAPPGIRRSVQLEMEGGQKLDGTIELRAILVDSDLGQFSIDPAKIKMIRFLKRVNEDDAEGEGVQRGVRGGVSKKMAMPQRDRHGNLLVPDQTSPTGTAWLTHGKVITTSDKEIIGDIHIPTDFKLELDFGHLSPAPDKLRILTLTDARPADAPRAGAGASAEASRSGGPDRSRRPELKKP